MNFNAERRKFNKLTYACKRLELHRFGRYLMSTEYGEYVVNLYSVNGMLVETWFSIANQRVELITAPTYRQLDLHTNRILFTLNT